MILDVKDDKLVDKLLSEDSADKVDLFKAYYSEEVDTRLSIIKDNTNTSFDEEVVKKHFLTNYVAAERYDEAFNSLLEEMLNFIG